MKRFLLEILRQLFGWSQTREGKLVFTRNAFIKMNEYQLNENTLIDVFRYGEEVDKGDKKQVTRQYAYYSVGLWYKVIYTPIHKNIQSEKRFLIITCWKGGE
jgi:hypothetical protein